MTVSLFVPGRVCLLGEHSDWAGGYRRINARIVPGAALVAGTNQGLHAEVRADPSRLRMRADVGGGQFRECDLPMEAEALRAETEAGGFFSYVAGVAGQAMVSHRVRGLMIDNYRTDLPVRRGLSSSAAACVLAARAFNRVYDLKLTVRGEMELAYQGEIATPSRCGRMDQACAFGNRAVLMHFDGDRMEARELSCGAPLHFLIADLHGSKDTIEILSRLNKCYPFPDNPDQERVHRCLGEKNARLLREAADAFVRGDPKALGALMNEAQREFDQALAPMCPTQLAAPLLHRALSHPPIQPLIWGAKGVGSGGDGSAQFLARDEASRDRLAEILAQDLGASCHPLTLGPVKRARKAVIPAAGLGTRMFPASKIVKKEFFPVIDRDGQAMPAIAASVAEALSAGVDEVAVIIRPSDQSAFSALFHDPPKPEIAAGFTPDACERHDRFLELGSKVTLIEQARPEGLGHAVWRAASWIGHEPFLLLLPDHLYRGEGKQTCARDLVDAYDRLSRPVVGLVAEPLERIQAFGCAGGTWAEAGSVLEISHFAEKPRPEHAARHLSVPGLPLGHYFTLSGQYVLTPGIFPLLERAIRDGVRAGGEFQLTPRLDELRRGEGFYGHVLRGRRFDIGQPEGYRSALAAWGAPAID